MKKIKTLEDFLHDQCGMITPKLLALLEPHREFIEIQIKQINDEDDQWDNFCAMLWDFYLPEVPKDAFKT